MEEPVTPTYLREQAAKCRRLAKDVADERTATSLRSMADDYEVRARLLAGAPPPGDDENQRRAAPL